MFLIAQPSYTEQREYDNQYTVNKGKHTLGISSLVDVPINSMPITIDTMFKMILNEQ